MAWVTRGDRAYYYRSRRVGTLVQREYLGSGKAAQEAADGIEQRRAQRATDAEAVREAEQRHAEATAPLEWLLVIVDLAVRATLGRRGYHQHAHGAWRRRRVPKHAQPAGTAHRGAEGHHPAGPPG